MLQVRCGIAPYVFSAMRSFALRALGLSFDFIVRGRDWFSIYLFQRCLAFLFIDPFVRRIDQVLALLAEEILDDAIFQRVEGDDCESFLRASRAATACGRTSSMEASSSFTAIRSAWNVLVAG